MLCLPLSSGEITRAPQVSVTNKDQQYESLNTTVTTRTRQRLQVSRYSFLDPHQPSTLSFIFLCCEMKVAPTVNIKYGSFDCLFIGSSGGGVGGGTATP